jgi:hypothetical protein
MRTLSARKFAVVLFVAVCVAEQTANSAIITVTNTADSGAGSFRQAILDANNEGLNPGQDIIAFDTSGAFSTPQTITALFTNRLINTGATATDWQGPTAYRIMSDIVINGSANGLTILAQQSGAANNVTLTQRIFTVNSGASLTLNDMTLTGGVAKGGNGGNQGGRGAAGGGALGAGGAIFNDKGTLTVSDVIFSSNSAVGGNGGGTTSGSTSGGGAGGGGMAGNGGNGNSASSGGNPGGAGGGANGGAPSNQSGGVGGGASGAAGINVQNTARGGFGGGGGASGNGSSRVGGNGGFGGGGAAGSRINQDNGSGGYGAGGNTGDGAGAGAGMGGAIFNLGGTVTLTNSTFTLNSAIRGNASNTESLALGLGGAIFNANGVLNGSGLTFATDNVATGGGANVFSLGITVGTNADVSLTTIDGQTATSTSSGTVSIADGYTGFESRFTNNTSGGTSNVVFEADAGDPAQIALSAGVSDTVITGGTGTLGLTVDNSATSGSDDLDYTVSPSAVAGVVYGAVTPAPALLGPDAAPVAHTFTAATSGPTPLGNNTVTVTVSDPAADNDPQTLDVTLTVLDHSDAEFVSNTGTNTLDLDFGTLTANSGIFDLQYQIENVVAAFRAALDLDTINEASDPSAAYSTNATTFTDLAAGGVSSFFDVFFDTTGLTPGTHTAQYTFALSDEDGLSGSLGGQTLTLNVTAEIEVAAVPTPEPSAMVLAAFALACLGMLRRKR